MKAFVHAYGELKVKDMNEPFADHGQVKVSLKTAGLNRRDVAVPGRRGDEAEPLILGSDGAGVVEAIGEGVSEFSVGDEVIVNPSLGWYENAEAPPKQFDILGMPDNGTFTETIVLPAEQLEKKPEHLSWEEAGVLALSGLTGYRALFTKGNLQAEDTLFIPGAGSGVATYLIQFAKKAGARVIVSSRSEEKCNQALELGADRAIDTNSDWSEELKDETIDIVIDSVGQATFNRSLDVLEKGGRFVTFGATTDDTVELNLRKFFYGQYKLIGSTMGSQEELHAMLEYIEQHEIHPIVDRSFLLDDAQSALDYLKASKQFGKVVLKVSD
ncbi:zinc-binding alcohol dehydrogenase/oxidoreductase [Lentibacillus persicus]|uniref:Zinc-binding alcohol dehydrogenase/oxidoreductase n=1 Tax=Lentibacillus persicus TaxID=640948 RepID=A0A1I1SNW0_9BACI|nr:zinc-binding dehydrogenase [Lentibacillus persicus]SFD46418.1 zinc-binding alcohol dehydrogenase/oxidoreductase [Lentibacillus persicus]